MRRGRCAWILLCAALLAGAAAAPAHAISGVYALQQNVAAGTGTLMQYTVGADGALTASAPDTPIAAFPQDLTVTPDGRFAYVATSTSIIPFTRVAANGRLEPGTADAAAGGGSAILVTPQGTRVIHAQAGGIATRAINADGTLGAPSTLHHPRHPAARHRAVARDDRRRAQPLRERADGGIGAHLPVRRRSGHRRRSR